MSQPPTNDCSGARTYSRLRHGCRGQQLTETIVRSFSLQQGQGVETESMPRSLTRYRDSVAVDTPRRVNRTATRTNMPNNYRGCLRYAFERQLETANRLLLQGFLVLTRHRCVRAGDSASIENQ
jgi:hypothetical protein